MTYYCAKLLSSVARDPIRKSFEQKRAIKGLYAIYQNCNYEELKKCLEENFPQKQKQPDKIIIGTGNFANTQDIKFYIKKELGKLYKMSHNESVKALSFYVLNLLCEEEPMTTYLNNEFQQNLESFSNKEIIKTALKKGMPLEYLFADFRKKNKDFYLKEIHPLCIIQVEGDQYSNNQNKGNHQPLWATSKFNERLESCSLRDFLRNDSKVWLIQGNAGTGKTLLLKNIEYFLWQNQGINPRDSFIPIYIRLSEVRDVRRCLEETFQKHGHSGNLVQEMKENSKRRYIFIFDGYDELKSPKNLYVENKMKEFTVSKVIITSREEYLQSYGEYVNYFKSNDADSQNNVLFEYRITPVTESEREKFIKRTVEKNLLKYGKLKPEEKKKIDKPWGPMKYTQEIKRIGGLELLMTTPYMLKTIVDILPTLSKRNQEQKKVVTRASIYKYSTKKFFEVQENRMLSNENIPAGYDLKLSFYNFSKDLAFTMWMNNRTSIDGESVNYTSQCLNMESKKDANPFAIFFLNDSKTKLARDGAEIISIDNEVRFIHKSIMEYFAARVFYDTLKHDVENFIEGKEKQFSNILNIFSQKLLKGNDQIDKESDVLNFLVDMINDNDYELKKIHENKEDEITKSDIHIITKLIKILTSKKVIVQANLKDINTKVPIEIFSRNILRLSLFIPKTFKVIKQSEGFNQLSLKDSAYYAEVLAAMVLSDNANSKIEKYAGETKKLIENNSEKVVPHGKGMLSDSDGYIYEGNFDNGIKSGDGKLINIDGEVYTGEFRNDHFYKGKLYNLDGTIIEGLFENEKIKDGMAKTYNSEGGWLEVFFQNGAILEGFGKIRVPWKKGFIYEGQIKKGKISAKSAYAKKPLSFTEEIVLLPEKSIVYEDFCFQENNEKNELKEGKIEEKVVFENGSILHGIFEDGNICTAFGKLNNSDFASSFERFLENKQSFNNLRIIFPVISSDKKTKYVIITRKNEQILDQNLDDSFNNSESNFSNSFNSFKKKLKEIKMSPISLNYDILAETLKFLTTTADFDDYFSTSTNLNDFVEASSLIIDSFIQPILTDLLQIKKSTSQTKENSVLTEKKAEILARWTTLTYKNL